MKSLRFPFSPAGASGGLFGVVLAYLVVWARGVPADITKGLPGQWRAEVRIPMTWLTSIPPGAGAKWRINFFRHDKEHGLESGSDGFLPHTGTAWLDRIEDSMTGVG